VPAKKDGFKRVVLFVVRLRPTGFDFLRESQATIPHRPAFSNRATFRAFPIEPVLAASLYGAG
jgi:hypothetical protein